ncbi:MAG: prolyl oligopeptidase family serine peptidase [Verrucomicrobiales bacterium]|nr:prolyl oligopeptidase family serine peptidase [Verrucomicrobiales bacterium]
MRILTLLLTLTVTSMAEDKAGTWPVKRLQTEVPEYRIEDEAAPIQSILYAGEPVGGGATEVFAFYASPKTIGGFKEGTKVPGIVLIHGGGGTAFSDWVWMWAKRGYAAIAMDLSGRRPPAPQFDENGEKVPDFAHKKELRVRLDKAGLDHTHKEKFDSIGGGIDDDWPYHTVCNVMKAHTILRNMPEVDSEKTAVTGISWGGYSTCLSASIDDRFKAAVPVYGCGFLHEGESVQKPSIDALGDRRQAWVDAYDPGSHLGKCETPTFWVNGTHDQHYVLDSYHKSYSRVPGPKSWRIEPRMRHSHGAGWEPKEIGLFVDSILLGAIPLPKVGQLTVDGGKVKAPVSSETAITKVELHYTEDDGRRTERKWKMIPGKIVDGEAVADGMPESANTFLMTITDERDAMVTSPIGFQ